MEARSRLFSDEDVHKMSAKIRHVSEVKTASPKQPAHKIWPIQHSEIFDDPEVVNGLRLPLAVGDIFETTNKKYILINPPCDLAVRSTGDRQIREAVIAEIVPDERKNSSWELKYFVQGATAFVDFKKTHTIKLAVLDLCVYNKDGRATIQLNQEAPVDIVPAWQRRYVLLKKEIRKLVGVFDKVKPSEPQREEIVAAIFKCSNQSVFTPTYDASTGVLSYDFRRTNRLSQPRAGLLLQKYADFLTREALEQDLETRLPPAENPVPAAGSEATRPSADGK